MHKNPVPVTDPNERIDRPKTAPEKTHWEIVLEELEVEEKRISNTNVSPIIFRCLQNFHFPIFFFQIQDKNPMKKQPGIQTNDSWEALYEDLVPIKKSKEEISKTVFFQILFCNYRLYIPDFHSDAMISCRFSTTSLQL